MKNKLLNVGAMRVTIETLQSFPCTSLSTEKYIIMNISQFLTNSHYTIYSQKKVGDYFEISIMDYLYYIKEGSFKYD